MHKGILATTVALSVLAAAPGHATIVFADDFNDLDVSDWAFSTNYGGTAGVDLAGLLGPYIDAPPGGSNLIARSTKTLNLLAGDYVLSLDARSVPCSGCTISYDVLFDGVLLARTATSGAWTFPTFNLGSLAAGTYALTLGMHTTNASSGHFLATFDNVVLEGSNLVGGIPEPASWAMMIAGFGLIGAAMRRRVASAA